MPGRLAAFRGPFSMAIGTANDAFLDFPFDSIPAELADHLTHVGKFLSSDVVKIQASWVGLATVVARV